MRFFAFLRKINSNLAQSDFDVLIFDMEKYEFVRILGAGAGGKVLLAKELENGRLVLCLL